MTDDATVNLEATETTDTIAPAKHYKKFTYRLYPSRSQARCLEATLETCRRWYNQCLEERKTAWEQHGERISKRDQKHAIATLRQINHFATQVCVQTLQVVCEDLDLAFQAFFRRIKAGQTPGFPRFRGRNRFDSFGFQAYGNGWKIDGRRLRLFGVGRVAVRWDRRMDGATIKTLRIIRKGGKWFASFACEVAPSEPLPATGQDVGIDVGVRSLITTSDGEQVAHPNFYRKAQRRLRVAQRRVARRKKGGKNRRKAVLQLQRAHLRITNQRQDFLKKLAHSLIQRYDWIALEDLRITNMVRNRHLAKSILDAGWGYLTQHLTRKAAEAGRVVCLVDPAYTSKTCSQCGATFEGLTLADRWVSCGVCGLSLDRDHNAALNIRNRAGRVRWGISSSLDGLPQVSAAPRE
ncbi:MAG TPA: transposase [Roseiflexaceae bacterium]|nr:transposase [Roseiflexaceae bacterium]